MKLSPTAERIVANSYAQGSEDWDAISHRVSAATTLHEPAYTDLFNEMINDLWFIPGGRILRNAGHTPGALLNCYVLPIGDSIEDIGTYIKESLILWAGGGGVGCNFSTLRPKQTAIKGKGGESSGLLSFLQASDATAACIRSGGDRRAAGLACVAVDHPEVMNFVQAKVVDGTLTNYNLSVGITNEFLEAVESNAEWNLTFNQTVYKTLPARELWEYILEYMVEVSEPGLLNFTNLTKNNSYYFAPIVSSNPSLRRGTRVLTSEGIYPIECLEGRQIRVRGLNGRYSPAECFLSGKNKKLYRITLQGRHCLYATAEHKWPTVNTDRWKYGSDDIIKKQTSELKAGDHLPQPTFKTSLEYGSDGDYEDGFCIGWNIGDGWISNNDRPDQIGFIVSGKEYEYGIDARLSKKLQTLGWTGKFRSVRGNKEVNIQNKNVREFFNKFGVRKKTEGLPVSMWSTASEDFRRGFIDALYSSDGSVQKTGGGTQIVLTTSQEKLAYDVSELLGFYGIQSSIQYYETSCGKFPNGKSYEKTYKRYNVCISRQSSVLKFTKVFELSHKEKARVLEATIASSGLIAPKNTMEIVSVEEMPTKEDVWDIRVYDESHCFELSQVVTGNCGEIPLEEYGSCCLGSLVLPRYVMNNGNTSWSRMEEIIQLAIRFLDNVLDINKYTFPQTEKRGMEGRRIGLGVMGLAEYLYLKRLRYGSPEALNEIEKLMKFIRNIAYTESVRLSQEKGSFTKFEPVPYVKSKYVRQLPVALRNDIKQYGIRNVTLMGIAPTGSISQIAGVSSGVEPVFSLCYKRADTVESINVHPLYSQAVNETAEIPDYMEDAHTLSPEAHLETQSAIQKYVDGAVSKTINVRQDFTTQELGTVLLEYVKDLKGVTVYRDGSKEGQPLVRLDPEETMRKIKNQEITTTVDAGGLTQQCATGACDI